MARPPRLTDAELASPLAALSGWRREGDQIVRTYEFETYAHGALFVAAVAGIADRMDHHPDLILTYRRVEMRTSTHDAGGLTALDLALAEKAEFVFSGR